MHKILKRFLVLAVLACVPLVLTACGGGGNGGPAVEMTTISGVAVKGPIKGALVQVFKLRSDGATGDLLGSGTSDGNAAYTIAIPKAKAVAPLLIVVSGQAGATYTSETTGNEVAFTSAESFRAILDTFDAGKKYTVSPLTEAAYQQLQKVLTDNPTLVVDSQIISAENLKVANLYNVGDILADPATDPVYAAALIIIDQMVETSKGDGATNTSQTMALINRAFADVKGQPYQSYRAELTTAAEIVVNRDPNIATTVNAIVTTAVNPPAEPIWTDTTAPNAITHLQAVAGAETAATASVTLAWSAATTTGANPVAGYDVYRNGGKIASVSTTIYIDKPLTLATSYSYYVVAFDAAGNRSAASAVVSATTPSAPNLDITVNGQLSSGILALPQQDIYAPTVPLGLTASTSAISATNSSVQLTWSPSTDNQVVTGYEVYRDGSKIATVSLPGYTDASVTSGTTYIYMIRALDAAGNRSLASNQLSVKPNQASLGVTVSGQVSP